MNRPRELLGQRCSSRGATPPKGFAGEDCGEQGAPAELACGLGPAWEWFGQGWKETGRGRPLRGLGGEAVPEMVLQGCGWLAGREFLESRRWCARPPWLECAARTLVAEERRTLEDERRAPRQPAVGIIVVRAVDGCRREHGPRIDAG